MMSAIVPLSELSPVEIKSIKASLITEHFRWAPESFAKGGMDLANTTMYAATKQVDEELQRLVQEPPQDETRLYTLQEGDVQKGIYRLETLLETAIDDAFDRFELYVLRNTFTVSSDIVPYIALTHQEHIDIGLKGKDQEAIDEYEQELRLYEEEIARESRLACVNQLMQRKLLQAQAKADETGHMGAANPMSARVQGLIPQVELLQERLAALAQTPAPTAAKDITSSEGNPWSSRAAFVNWAATTKVDALPSGDAGSLTARRYPGQSDSSNDATLSQIHDKMRKTGKQEDAASLMGNL